jgi:hypothetical protein
VVFSAFFITATEGAYLISVSLRSRAVERCAISIFFAGSGLAKECCSTHFIVFTVSLFITSFAHSCCIVTRDTLNIALGSVIAACAALSLGFVFSDYAMVGFRADGLLIFNSAYNLVVARSVFHAVVSCSITLGIIGASFTFGINTVTSSAISV